MAFLESSDPQCGLRKAAAKSPRGTAPPAPPLLVRLFIGWAQPLIFVNCQNLLGVQIISGSDLRVSDERHKGNERGGGIEWVMVRVKTSGALLLGHILTVIS